MVKAYKYILVVFSLLIFLKCEDDRFIESEDAKLQFSVDTLFFDTVFTTVGTKTMAFKIYNPHNRNILISDIYLAGAQNSVFRINIDGESVRRMKDKKVPPKDSLYIFVEATVNPNNDTMPVVVKDSIVFVTNNNIQDVKLLAWGQDMHYFRRDFTKTATWKNDKPYVIYDYLIVDSNEVLTIEEGVQLYLHWNARLYVLGSLIVNGTKENPVVFQGDRLEFEYDVVKGQWFAIQLMEGSKGNKIDHAIIKNSVFGLWLGWPANDRNIQVDVTNTMITNTTAEGIISFGAHMNMTNSIISHNGNSCISALRGGKYNFYHCTFINNSAGKPAVLFANHLTCPEGICEEETIKEQELEEANFFNSIIYGNNPKESEIEFSGLDNSDVGLNYYFDHCLLRVVLDSFDIDNPKYFNGNIFNLNPKIVDDQHEKLIYNTDYRLDTLSPAKDAGSVDFIQDSIDATYDFEGTSRLEDNAPDLGAFERRLS